MRRFWTLSGGVATAASLGIAALALHPAPTPAGAAPMRGLAVRAMIAQGLVGSGSPAKGAGSCAAAACHGSATPAAASMSFALRNEHTTWVTSDPHAGAFNVLLGERSKSIARNLGKRAGGIIDADKDARCLACHATPSAGTAEPELARAIRADGVGCESCHGNAGGWLSAHTAATWPAQKADGSAAALGFVDLRDLNARAQSCAGCHVGAPADPARGLPLRDVNHDLIAAGHPRLSWEYSAYLANYPKHWRLDPSDRDRDARLWLLGQVATMRAALDLLSDRAHRAEARQAPWPELSEYGCFSCHFALKEKPFRGHRDEEVPLGVPAWGSWEVPMLRALTRKYPGAPTLDPKLGDLRKLMSKLGAADPKEVASQADALRADLDTWLKSARDARLDAAQVRALLSAINDRDASGRRTAVTGWDSAAQLYLGLAALHAALGSLDPVVGPDPKLRAELEALRKELEFQPRLDSPAGFGDAVNRK